MSTHNLDKPMWMKWMDCFTAKILGGVGDVLALAIGFLAQVVPSLPKGDNEAQRWVLYGVAIYLIARAIVVLLKGIVDVIKKLRDGDRT